MLPEVEERFWRKVDTTPGHGPNGDCWAWTSTINSKGYGHFKVDGGQRGAHRVAWELVHGPIPGRMFVCHRCDNRKCVNPAHLFLGTNAENLADMARKGRGREARGSRNSFARLSEPEVREIREMLGSGATQRAVAARFNVASSTISHIATGKGWAHVA